MGNFLQVKTDTVSWQKALDDEEFSKVKEYAKTSHKSLNTIDPLMYPVRTTNGLKNFLGDLFLPATTNLSLKIQSIFLKSVVSCATAICDIVTMPIRLITLLPRMYANARREEVPFRAFLRDQACDPRLINAESVRVKLVHVEDVVEVNGIYTEQQRLQKKEIHFAQVPWQNKSTFTESHRTKVWLKDTPSTVTTNKA